MTDPVRIRLYGLSLTRQGYMRFLAAGLGLTGVLLVVWAVVLGGPPDPAESARPPDLVILLRRFLPWVILAAAVLEALEAFVVLRRFRRAEAERPGGSVTLGARNPKR